MTTPNLFVKCHPGFNAIVGNLNPFTVLMMCDSRGREVFTR